MDGENLIGLGIGAAVIGASIQGIQGKGKKKRKGKNIFFSGGKK